MPITRIQFHAAANDKVASLMQSIHAFLSEDREQAYSEGEIQSALGPGENGVAISEALRALHGLNAIRWGIINGEDYYIYNGDIPAAALAS